jgi:hypothetical protein
MKQALDQSTAKEDEALWGAAAWQARAQGFDRNVVKYTDIYVDPGPSDGSIAWEFKNLRNLVFATRIPDLNFSADEEKWVQMYNSLTDDILIHLTKLLENDLRIMNAECALESAEAYVAYQPDDPLSHKWLAGCEETENPMLNRFHAFRRANEQLVRDWTNERNKEVETVNKHVLHLVLELIPIPSYFLRIAPGRPKRRPPPKKRCPAPKKK